MNDALASVLAKCSASLARVLRRRLDLCPTETPVAPTSVRSGACLLSQSLKGSLNEHAPAFKYQSDSYSCSAALSRALRCDRLQVFVERDRIRPAR